MDRAFVLWNGSTSIIIKQMCAGSASHKINKLLLTTNFPVLFMQLLRVIYSVQNFIAVRSRLTGSNSTSEYSSSYFLSWQAAVERTFIQMQMAERNVALDYEVIMLFLIFSTTGALPRPLVNRTKVLLFPPELLSLMSRIPTNAYFSKSVPSIKIAQYF